MIHASSPPLTTTNPHPPRRHSQITADSKGWQRGPFHSWSVSHGDSATIGTALIARVALDVKLTEPYQGRNWNARRHKRKVGKAERRHVGNRPMRYLIANTFEGEHCHVYLQFCIKFPSQKTVLCNPIYTTKAWEGTECLKRSPQRPLLYLSVHIENSIKCNFDVILPQTIWYSY